MKKIELKIHPGRVYEVHEKEFEDLRRMGMITRVIDDSIHSLEIDNAVDNLPEEFREEEPEVEEKPVIKKRTYKRKTSPSVPSSE